jgi:hypothetical protein
MKPDLIARHVHGRLLWLELPFVIALAQELLFRGNQNTKYLQGAGATGYGHLEHDGMATPRTHCRCLIIGIHGQ